MKVEMGGVGRGIGAGPSLGAARIGVAGIGMRPMGFGGIKGPESAMSVGARTLAKAWSPINIGRAEKGINRSFGRKSMDNIQIRSTIQRRLQGARYLGAPEVMTNKGIENIQRVSTPDKRAMRVLSLVGSRMPFVVSRENPVITLNLAQKKTETPKGMEVVFPTQPRPKPEIKLGQVVDPATTPAASAETAQVLKTVLALKKAGMTEQARKVAQNIKPEQRNVVQVARVVESLREESVKKPVETKKVRRENEENTDSKKDSKKFKLVRDEKTYKARLEVVARVVKRLFGWKDKITGQDLLAEIPSGGVNNALKSEVVRGSDKADHTWETYIPADIKAQKFESETEALEAMGNAMERHEPVAIAENGKVLGYEALRKVHDPKDGALSSVASYEEEIIFKTEQVKTTKTETVFVDDEVVSKTTNSEEQQPEEPKAKLDLVKLGIVPDLKELLKTVS